jgi:predicted HTH domain antitoxin
VAEWLVLSLFTEERISSGKAARLLNISRIEFLALLRVRGIAFIDYTDDELPEEFEAVEALGNQDVI